MAICKECIHYNICNDLVFGGGTENSNAIGCKHFKPTADVVPRAEVEATLKQYKDTVKSEVDRLVYTLAGVMFSVDKWLDGEELNQDEVRRAITMREKNLQIVENLQIELESMRTAANSFKMHLENARTDVAREIF